MSDLPEKPTSGVWGALIGKIFSSMPDDTREMVGTYVGMFLIIAAPVVIIGVAEIVENLVTQSKEPTTKCWNLQEIDNKIFKINSCTGEMVEISHPNENDKKSADVITKKSEATLPGKTANDSRTAVSQSTSTKTPP